MVEGDNKKSFNNCSKHDKTGIGLSIGDRKVGGVLLNWNGVKNAGNKGGW